MEQAQLLDLVDLLQLLTPEQKELLANKAAELLAQQRAEEKPTDGSDRQA